MSGTVYIFVGGIGIIVLTLAYGGTEWIIKNKKKTIKNCFEKY